MKNVMIKDLMVPLSEYATVKEDASLQEVAAALKAAQAKFYRGPYPHRAMPILGDQDNVVGVEQADG
jgi:CBS domain-containing protein